MFQKMDAAGNWMHFDFKPHIKDGNLHCPRCMAAFVGPKNELLTEHGIVYQEQKSVDTGFSIVHGEGMFKGMLGHIKDSRPATEEAGETIDYPDIDTKLVLKEPDSSEADATWQKPEPNKKPKLICEFCGKKYDNTDKGRPWYEKHIKKCGEKNHGA
jgi:hypothetical protein